jgi:hypothetical protein
MPMCVHEVSVLFLFDVYQFPAHTGKSSQARMRIAVQSQLTISETKNIFLDLNRCLFKSLRHCSPNNRSQNSFGDEILQKENAMIQKQIGTYNKVALRLKINL